MNKSENKYINEVPDEDYVFSFDLYSSTKRSEAMLFTQKINKYNNAYANNMRFSTRTVKDGKNKYHVVCVIISTSASNYDAALSVINFLCEKIAIIDKL